MHWTAYTKLLFVGCVVCGLWGVPVSAWVCSWIWKGFWQHFCLCHCGWLKLDALELLSDFHQSSVGMDVHTRQHYGTQIWMSKAGSLSSLRLCCSTQYIVFMRLEVQQLAFPGASLVLNASRWLTEFAIGIRLQQSFKHELFWLDLIWNQDHRSTKS